MAALDDAEASVPDLNAVLMLRIGPEPGGGAPSLAAEGASRMSAWIDRILKEFTADLARLWIAADPDDVLLDERVLSGLRERGFELLPFEDSVAFRAEYEERYRAAWDLGQDGPVKGPDPASARHQRRRSAVGLPESGAAGQPESGQSVSEAQLHRRSADRAGASRGALCRAGPACSAIPRGVGDQRVHPDPHLQDQPAPDLAPRGSLARAAAFALPGGRRCRRCWPITLHMCLATSRHSKPCP